MLSPERMSVSVVDEACLGDTSERKLMIIPALKEELKIRLLKIGVLVSSNFIYWYSQDNYYKASV